VIRTPSRLRLIRKDTTLVRVLSTYYCCVYYETIKGELKRRPIYEGRCDERLETRLIDERFENVMCVCVCERDLFNVIGESSIFNVISSTSTLDKIFPTTDLRCEEILARR
jgi:hypothetical protein